MLETVRQVVSDFGIAVDDNVYMGKLDAKSEKSIGVYNSKHTHDYKRALGGTGTYGAKYVTLLVHWNESPRQTEKAACDLFRGLEQVRDLEVDEEKIKFIQPLVNEPVEIGTDDSGIHEMVIEAVFYYERKGE